jgi:peptide/nickel transport system ATP-binding protein
VNNLSISYKQNGQTAEVIHNISFAIKKKEALAILGESGSGKSTIAKALCGLLPVSAQIKNGILSVGQNLNLELSGKRTDWKGLRGTRIGIIFQDAQLALNPVMKIADHFKETLLYHKIATPNEIASICISLLKRLNFSDIDRVLCAYPFQLSGGMCQRICIALALCLKPNVLIADEPTSALDVMSQKEVIDLIKHIRNEFNVAVLLITHDIAVARANSDEVMMLNKGIIEEKGDTEMIFSNPAASYTKELIASRARIETIGCVENASSSAVLLDIESLEKSFYPRKNRVLSGLNLQLHEKEVIGILGKSGCGKSTLAKCIVGLEKLDKGTVRYRGNDITALSGGARREICQHIQIVFQDARASLNPRHTALRLVGEPLRYFNRGNRKEQDEKARYYLEQVCIDDDACNWRPPQLSTGQCQRIAIARALVLEPDILICDEAVSALDMSIQAQILALLSGLHKKLGFSILMISHDIRILRNFCHLIAVMKDGKFCEINQANSLMTESKDPYTRLLLECELVYD